MSDRDRLERLIGIAGMLTGRAYSIAQISRMPLASLVSIALVSFVVVIVVVIAFSSFAGCFQIRRVDCLYLPGSQ
jgi:hypothetical protein